ncbi:MAG: cell division protein ZipA [Halioglobus sp.]|nr:cell division protein ZipA [Halioglobus sp.]
MDLTIRDWMVVIGVVLIVAVGLDAWRRVQRERRPKVKVKLAPAAATGTERENDLAWLKELPNGGARVVDRHDLINATNKSDAAKREKAAAAAAKTPKLKAQPRPASGQAPASSAATEAEELVSGMSGGDGEGEPATLDWLDNIEPDEDDSLPPLKRPAVEAGRLPRDVDPEVFMLNVIARDREGFRGEDILHILLACDLRFGDMNFFHRHEFEAGRGAIQFSVANMMQPGVFDIDHMGDFNTPGLVFFLTLPGPEDMMKAFDYMLETAQAVARNLNGDVLDESRSVLSRQSLEHCRQQIRDLERRMLARTR